MNRKAVSGLVGIVVGVLWMLMNIRHVPEQGFVAIGMPLIIAVLGVVYFLRNRNH